MFLKKHLTLQNPFKREDAKKQSSLAFIMKKFLLKQLWHSQVIALFFSMVLV